MMSRRNFFGWLAAAPVGTVLAAALDVSHDAADESGATAVFLKKRVFDAEEISGFHKIAAENTREMERYFQANFGRIASNYSARLG
jgi:hypothetical protein